MFRSEEKVRFFIFGVKKESFRFFIFKIFIFRSDRFGVFSRRN